VVGKGEAIYETAGILKQGKAVFLLAALPDYIKILGSADDKIKQYVLLANWHDGTSCLLAMLTPIRVVCNNTLNLALSGAQSQVSIRHTPVADERMKEAAKTMGIVNQYTIEMEKAFNTLALTKVSADDIVKYVESLFPVVEGSTDRIAENVKERREKIMELVEVGEGATLDTAKGTMWGGFQAVTEYVDHETSFRSDDARASSLLIGAGRQMAQKAFDLALLISAAKNSTKYTN
jgi:phage/plasmid-like protein (TIGR03299 family)